MRRLGTGIANLLASFGFLAFNALLWPLLWWRFPPAQSLTNFSLSAFTLLVDVFFLLQQRWQREDSERHTQAQAGMMRTMLAILRALESRDGTDA